MSAFQINISDVVRLVKANGMSSEDRPFSIRYRKVDGDAGRKSGVMRRAGKGHLNQEQEARDVRSIERVESNASKFHLIDGAGHRFEVFVCLVTHFNDLLIDHRF